MCCLGVDPRLPEASPDADFGSGLAVAVFRVAPNLVGLTDSGAFSREAPLFGDPGIAVFRRRDSR
jgi:hypothetical protein